MRRVAAGDIASQRFRWWLGSVGAGLLAGKQQRVGGLWGEIGVRGRERAGRRGWRRAARRVEARHEELPTDAVGRIMRRGNERGVGRGKKDRRIARGAEARGLAGRHLGR